MKRHSADITSLAFGVVFIGIAAWWLVGRYIDVNVPNPGWIIAAALIVLGLFGVAGSLRSAPEPPPPSDESDQAQRDQAQRDQAQRDETPPAGQPTVEVSSPAEPGTTTAEGSGPFDASR